MICTSGDNYHFFPIHYNTKTRTEHGTVQGIRSMSLPPNVCIWYKSLGSYSKGPFILAWINGALKILGEGTYFETPRYSRKDSVQHNTVSKQILWSGWNNNYLIFSNSLFRNCFVSDRSTRGGFEDAEVKICNSKGSVSHSWFSECLFETWNIRWIIF